MLDDDGQPLNRLYGRKRMILIMILLLLSAGTSHAVSSVDLEEPRLPVGSVGKSSSQPNYKTEHERSGCCSHHGGVCGCSNGRAQCCDGTLSPTCTC